MMKEDLLKEIDEFLARHGKSPSWLGEKAFNDKSFVRDLRRSRSPSLKTVERLRKFMDEFDAQDQSDCSGLQICGNAA